jgi:hypothetical protein
MAAKKKEETVEQVSAEETTTVEQTVEAPAAPAVPAVPVEGSVIRDPDDPFGDPSAPRRRTYKELKARMDEQIEADGIPREITFVDVKGPNNSKRRAYFTVAGTYKK